MSGPWEVIDVPKWGEGFDEPPAAPERSVFHSITADSAAFHFAGTSALSNQIPTTPLYLNSAPRPEISTGLGDQGSQVRVLSPRLVLRCSRFQRTPPRCTGLYFAGISTLTPPEMMTNPRARLSGASGAAPPWPLNDPAPMARVKVRRISTRRRASHTRVLGPGGGGWGGLATSTAIRSMLKPGP